MSKYIFCRKKEIDAMLMDMIEKSREVGDKEQENGTSEINGVTQEEDDKEDEESLEVWECLQ